MTIGGYIVSKGSWAAPCARSVQLEPHTADDVSVTQHGCPGRFKCDSKLFLEWPCPKPLDALSMTRQSTSHRPVQKKHGIRWASTIRLHLGQAHARTHRRQRACDTARMKHPPRWGTRKGSIKGAYSDILSQTLAALH